MVVMALTGTVLLVKDHTLFRALFYSFVQAEMNSEENGLPCVHSDLSWGTQPDVIKKI